MPKINRITARRAQVGPRPDPEALGAGEGRALASIGTAVGNVGDVFTQVTEGYYRQDTLRRAQEGDRKLRELAQQAGFQKFEDREKWFRENAAPIYEEAFDGVGVQSQPQLRLYMDESRNRFEASVRGTAYRDAANGAKLNLSNSLNMLGEDAAQAPSQLDAAGYMQRAYEAIEAYGADFGVSDAELADIRLGFEGRTEKLRAVAVQDQLSDMLVTEILTATDAAGNPLSKEARLEAVGQIGNEELRKDVKRRVEVTTNREEADRLRALDTLREGAWTAYLNGAGPESIPKDLPTKDQRALGAAMRERSAREAKGLSTQIVTDAKVWADAWDMAINNRDKFAASDIWSLRLQLETQDFNELKEAHTAMKSGNGDAGWKPALSSTDNTFLNNLLGAAGISDAQVKAQTKLNYKRAAEALRRELKRDLNHEERETLAGNMLPLVDVPSEGGHRFFAFGKWQMVGQMTEEDGARLLKYPPEDWLKEVMNAFEADGVAEPSKTQVDGAMRQLMIIKGIPIPEAEIEENVNEEVNGAEPIGNDVKGAPHLSLQSISRVTGASGVE